MMRKPKVGEKVIHKNRGICTVSELDRTNPDPTSLIVTFDGTEAEEVSLNLILTKYDIDKAYEEGKPKIADSVYDKVFGANATAEYLDTNSPWEKFKHTYGGGGASLTKTELFVKGEFNYCAIKQWMVERELVARNIGYPSAKSAFLIMWKFDGINISLYYEDGILVRAVTKGKNGIGEDILRNVLKMKNVRSEIPGFSGVLTAEIILRHSVFEKEKLVRDNGEPYSNVRNAAAGIAKKFDDNKYAHLLELKYHGLKNTNSVCHVHMHSFFLWLENLSLITKEELPKKAACFTDVHDIYNEMLKQRDTLDFDVDGIVVICDIISVQETLGYETGGNPKFATALKFPPNAGQTVVREIAIQGGRTGKLTPVAKVDIIDLGVEVTSATLHNVDRMNELRIKVGDTIIVSRRGDVIPHVEENLTKHETYTPELPDKCPTCGSPTIIDGAFLTCTNEACEVRQIGNLQRWIDIIKETFGSKGLDEKRLAEMFEKGIAKTIDALYELTAEKLINSLEHVKTSAAKNILEFQKYREWQIEDFFGGLGIPNMGRGVFKMIVDAGYKTVPAILGLNQTEVMKIKGIGEARANLLTVWLEKKKPLIDRLLTHIKIAVPKTAASDKLLGKSFCITGTLSKPRKYFEELIKNNGGVLKSVSGALNYLVVGADSGSKLDKAKKYGTVKILTEAEFMALIEG